MNDAREILLSWSWEPLTLFLVGLIGILYVRGWRRTRPLKIRVITPLRATSFVVGLTVLLLALISPLDALGSRLFTFHMAQHMLLTHVAVPLILLGAPVLPVLRGMGYGVRRATIVPAARSARMRYVYHVATSPLVTLALFVGCIWAWHVPSLYSVAVTNDFVHIAQHSSFIGFATLFWWSIIDPAPMQGRLPYLGRLVMVVLALSLTFPLAAMLTFAPEPWYEPYVAQAPGWTITPLIDQQIGGLIMWVGGIGPYFAAIAGLFAVAVRKDEEAAEQSQRPPSSGVRPRPATRSVTF